METKPSPQFRARVTVSDWARRALEGLSERKAYPVGILYTTALELGTADLIAHFAALEQVTPKGLDVTSLGSVLPGVEIEKARRKKDLMEKRAAKGRFARNG